MSRPRALPCRICAAESAPLARAEVLGRYDVQYYSCPVCGFIQTEEPYWLEEAYSSAIAQSDLGLIGRNIKAAAFCAALIPMAFDATGPCLDYGAGNGMFVRMMRDRGFDFYWQDAHASNQFAAGFEAEGGMHFSILTAFEVFEHLARPLETLSHMFRLSDTIIFSTRILPRQGITPAEWWYFTPDTGQHVSLYSMESLKVIARRFEVKLSSNGRSLHVFSVRRIPGLVLKLLSLSPLAAALSGILNMGRRSLLEDDYFRLTGRRLN